MYVTSIIFPVQGVLDLSAVRDRGYVSVMDESGAMVGIAFCYLFLIIQYLYIPVSAVSKITVAKFLVS